MGDIVVGERAARPTAMKERLEGQRGRLVVEHLTEPGGALGFRSKRAESLTHRRQRFEKERKERREPRGELRRVKVPPLEKARGQAVTHAMGMKTPRRVHRLAVADRQYGRCAIGKRDRRAGERRLHERLGEVAERMIETLG